MQELGERYIDFHGQVGRAVDKEKIDLLIVGGERARDIGRAARQNGCYPSHIYSFLKGDEAGQFLDEEIKAGDIILIKGSQGMRMERLVKTLMAEPEKAEKVLVRQDSIWQKS